MARPIRFAAKTRRELTDYVTQCFPDAQVDSQGNVLTGVALGLHLSGDKRIDLSQHAAALDGLAKDPQIAAKGLTANVAAELPVVSIKRSDTFRYYNVRATHDREDPDLDPFVGRIPMVRVRLPTRKSRSKNFKTAIGSVLMSDHFYHSVEEFRSRYQGSPPYDSAIRLDLITPPRANPFALRFGAISAYLGYLNEDAVPDFYVLEAGTATGQPKVPFPAPSFEAGIWAWAGYKPTPFTNKKHIYKGRLEWRESGTKRLSIEVRKNATSQPYMRLNAVFEETKKPWKIWPGFMILKAATIVLGRKSVVDEA